MAPDLEDRVPREILEALIQEGTEAFRKVLEKLLNLAMGLERSEFLGAEPYERTNQRRGHANGYKDKKIATRVGELRLKIPQVRGLSFYPQSLEKGCRSEKALKLAVAEMYVMGVSTRKVTEITEQLCGTEISASQVSRVASLLDEELEKFRSRPLGGEYPFVYLDAHYEKVRVDGRVQEQEKCELDEQPCMASNSLYYGDNLDILRRCVEDESVDLIYLDPPFNSNQTYNILFQEKDGTQSASQIKAFGDTWHWDETAARSYEETVEAGGQVAEAMQAFRKLLGTNDILAYMSMMAPRLVELRRVMKPTGSLYLHCDPTASHFLKLLLDAILGPTNFKNEIIWKRTSAHSSAKRYGPIHDAILFYTRGTEWTWNQQYQDYSLEYVTKFYRHKDKKGKHYTLGDLTAQGFGMGKPANRGAA